MIDAAIEYAAFTLDPAGRVATWNAGAQRVTGHAEEVIGQHLACFYAPEEQAAGLPDRALTAARTHGRHEEEGRRARKDGSLFWASVTVTPLTDAAGGVTGYAHILRNLSDRQPGDPSFRLLVEQMKDFAIILLDPVGTVLTWNAGAEAIFGFRAEEIIGRPYSVFFPPDARAEEALQQELDLARETGKADGTGWRVRKDGSRFWANGALTALFHDGGRLRGYAKVTRDLTERRRGEVLLHSILNHALDPIVCIDDRGRIETFNPAAERAFGFHRDEVVGQNVRVLMPEPDRGRHDGYLANYLRSGEARIIGIGREVLARRKDGTTFPVDLEVTEFRTEVDDRRHFVGILRDLTEQKRLEEQLRQAQKMEAVGQLAGGVAHDFNNLLTIINGYSELLLSVLPPDSALRTAVQSIGDAGDRAASLTRQLLAFSRQSVLAPRVLDLNAVVHEARNMLGRLIGAHITLTTRLTEGISHVMVDPGHLTQVLLNLAVNARDAMPSGGCLTLETAELELDAAYVATRPDVRPGQYVMLAVSDTGHGMTPEVKARIFEPFFTTKGVGKGTGLGLAVVHGIVKQSGGHIAVYSEVGHGTTFKIYLPAVTEQQARPRAAAEPVRRGTETVLLAEDEDGVRAIARLTLESFGYQVLPAGNGREALERAAWHGGPIHLLLTDVVMPGMGGRDLAREMVARYPGVKVLFMSGYTDDTVVRHGILEEKAAFLQKPYTPLALARTVREVLDAR